MKSLKNIRRVFGLRIKIKEKKKMPPRKSRKRGKVKVIIGR